MALEKIDIIDKIEVTEDGHIQVRRATYLVEDGVRWPNPLGYHREVHAPGKDVTREHAKIQAVAAAVWTEDVIEAVRRRA